MTLQQRSRRWEEVDPRPEAGMGCHRHAGRIELVALGLRTGTAYPQIKTAHVLDGTTAHTRFVLQTENNEWICGAECRTCE